MRTTLFEVPGRSGKAPRPRVGFGFDRDPGGGPDRRSRSDVPSRFRRAAGFVDLGFERFVKINTDHKAMEGRTLYLANLANPGGVRRGGGQGKRRTLRRQIGTRSAPELGPRPVEKVTVI